MLPWQTALFNFYKAVLPYSKDSVNLTCNVSAKLFSVFALLHAFGKPKGKRSKVRPKRQWMDGQIGRGFEHGNTESQWKN